MSRPYTLVRITKTLVTYLTVYDDEVADNDAEDASELAFRWVESFTSNDWEIADYEVEEIDRGED